MTILREFDEKDLATRLAWDMVLGSFKDGTCRYGVSAFKTKTSKERAVTP